MLSLNLVKVNEKFLNEKLFKKYELSETSMLMNSQRSSIRIKISANEVAIRDEKGPWVPL